MAHALQATQNPSLLQTKPKECAVATVQELESSVWRCSCWINGVAPRRHKRSTHHTATPTTCINPNDMCCRYCTGAGVFGVEMFLLADGALLLNEIAPRPHNSGHYTIEACATSQYEQHLRAILGWPLGDTSLVVGSRYVANCFSQ